MQSNQGNPKEEFDDLVQNHSLSGLARIRELMEKHGFEVPYSSPPLKLLNQLSSILQQQMMLTANFKQAKMKYYYECLKLAVEADSGKEILYLLKKNPKMFLDCKINNTDFFQSLLIHKKINIIDMLINSYESAANSTNLKNRLLTLIFSNLENTLSLAIQHNYRENLLDIFFRKLRFFEPSPLATLETMNRFLLINPLSSQITNKIGLWKNVTNYSLNLIKKLILI